jgi:hypothetical protein
MRWTFALLLLLNVGLWMWGVWYKNPAGEYEKAPRPPINAEKMRLLSEPGVMPRPRTPAGPASEPLAPMGSALSNQAPCYTIGPFLTRDIALKAGDKLRELKLVSAHRSEAKTTPAEYRVFLPPLMTRNAAEQKLKELNNSGIKDYSLRVTPEKRYAVSLGIFSQPANAENFRLELAKKGINAQIETLYPTSQHWLDLQAMQMSPKLLNNIKHLSWDSPDVRISEIICSATKGSGNSTDTKKNKKP